MPDESSIGSAADDARAAMAQEGKTRLRMAASQCAGFVFLIKTGCSAMYTSEISYQLNSTTGMPADPKRCNMRPMWTWRKPAEKAPALPGSPWNGHTLAAAWLIAE